MKRSKETFSLLLVILWVVLIFYLSHQPANKSNNLSKGISEVIVGSIEKIFPGKDFNLRNFNHILRKSAHFFAYLILGILVFNVLKLMGIKGYKRIGLGLFICVLFSISDEVHQLFVPGRGGQVKDVIIDSTGSLVGILSSSYLLNLRKT